MSGPGGVGKGTIVERLIELDDRIWLSRSWTTRDRRPGEADDSYVFVDRATFEAHVDAGGFLEWADFQGNLYGTPWPDAPEGYDVLLEIDVQGARSVRAQDDDALLIFVDAPSPEAQAHRLRGRGDSEDAVESRVEEGARERGDADVLRAVVVINDDLERAVAEVQEIIEGRRT